MRFPPPSEPFGSPAELIVSLRDFLSPHANLQPELTDLLVAFALATWFCDCMPVAPVLYLFGPDGAVSQVLRLLACLCHRPVLLGDVDFWGLSTLPNRLGATLLINQRDLGRRVKRALIASNRRHFCVMGGGQRLDLHGAKVFCCEDSREAVHGLRASVSPAQNPAPILTDSEEEVLAREFQAKLLRYRMVHYERVCASRIDCSAFVPEMREQASAWLASVVGCPELSKSVSEEILLQSKEAAETRFFDPKCVVSEAALFFCHQEGTVHFFVGELAGVVNGLLKGRHEEPEMSAKKVGLVLRELGLHSERVAEGYKVTLTDTTRERIHSVAFAYQVLPFQDGVRYCRDRRAINKSPQHL